MNDRAEFYPNLAARLLTPNLERHPDKIAYFCGDEAVSYLQLGDGAYRFASMLREQGYSLGGLLPIWFGDDGLLMQKHLVAPDFEGMKIYSDRGRSLMKLVRSDWNRSRTDEA